MKIPQDQRFREQRAQYRLRFNCEHCALFDERTETCAHGYPTTEHRERRYDDPNAALVFCKHFELT